MGLQKTVEQFKQLFWGQVAIHSLVLSIHMYVSIQGISLQESTLHLDCITDNNFSYKIFMNPLIYIFFTDLIL